MKKLVFMLTVLMISNQLFSQTSLGEVIGEVIDFKSQEPIIDAHVYIDDNGRRYQAKSDLDGRFRVSAIPAGTYLMNIRHGEDTLKNIIVEVPMDGFFNAGTIEFNSSVQMLAGTTVTAGAKLKLVDGNLPVRTLTSKEIAKSPLKFDINGMIASISSDVTRDQDGQLMFRGARKGDMIYLIDGIKTRDARSLPSVAIGSMMVYSGGIPAKYGDTLGGVVVIDSKSYFDMYRSWQAEQLKAQAKKEQQ